MSRNGQQQRKIRTKVVKKKLERRQVKERQKVARHILNLQQLGEADQNPVILELRQQLEANRKGHNELAQAFNKNFRTYSDAFQHLDARIGSLMLVTNDLVELLHSKGLLNEDILTTTIVKGIDDKGVEAEKHQPYWEAYISHYLKLVKVAADNAAEAEKEAQPLIESTSSDSDSDYADTTFGGEDTPHVEISSGGEASPSS